MVQPAMGRTPRETLDRCAARAEADGHSMLGSAFAESGVLLVELPGPWGRAGLTESRLDARVAAALEIKARQAGLRAIRDPAPWTDLGRQYAAVDDRRLSPRYAITALGDLRQRGRPARTAVGPTQRRRGGRTCLPRLHAWGARRVLRDPRTPDGCGAGCAPSGQRVGMQPSRRAPLQRQRAGAAERSPVRTRPAGGCALADRRDRQRQRPASACSRAHRRDTRQRRQRSQRSWKRAGRCHA